MMHIYRMDEHFFSFRLTHRMNTMGKYISDEKYALPMLADDMLHDGYRSRWLTYVLNDSVNMALY